MYKRQLVSRCDTCLGRLKRDEQPLCAASCENGAVQYIDEEKIEDKTNLYKLGDNVLVRALNWLDLYGIKK